MVTDDFKKAIDLAGGQVAMSRKLGAFGFKYTQAAISAWLRKEKEGYDPPAEICPTIEKITGVRCEAVRPDVDWSVLRRSCPCECAGMTPSQVGA